MSETKPHFEARYPGSYIGLVSFYIWCAQMMLFFASVLLPAYWSGENVSYTVMLQIALLLSIIGSLFACTFYYGSKLMVTNEGLVQSWLWGAITTELSWQQIDYHSYCEMPGIAYHTLKDKDDPSITHHIDIPTSLEFYSIFCRHMEAHCIDLEHGQVLRLSSPPRPITDHLREIYPQRYTGPQDAYQHNHSAKEQSAA